MGEPLATKKDLLVPSSIIRFSDLHITSTSQTTYSYSPRISQSTL